MTFRASLIDRVTRTKPAWDHIFPRWESELGDLSTKATDLHKASAPLLRDFFAAVDRALEAVERGAIDAATARGNTIYSEQERARRATVATNEAAEVYARHYATAAGLLERLSADFQRAGVPSRPQPADAAQEAALTNLRADLRMLLDPASEADLPNRFRDAYADALAAGDELRAWFLAGSQWPADYLTSRGATHLLPVLHGKLSEALEGAPERATFRQAAQGWTAVERGPLALRKILISLPFVARDELGIE